MRREAEIFDVDGTLCDVASVRHHVRGRTRNFDAFHEAALGCPPHAWVVERARTAAREGRVVVVVTARTERWRRGTEVWLALHDVPSDHLYLRGRHDGRPDVEISGRSSRRSVSGTTWCAPGTTTRTSSRCGSPRVSR